MGVQAVRLAGSLATSSDQQAGMQATNNQCRLLSQCSMQPWSPRTSGPRGRLHFPTDALHWALASLSLRLRASSDGSPPEPSLEEEGS